MNLMEGLPLVLILVHSNYSEPNAAQSQSSRNTDNKEYHHI